MLQAELKTKKSIKAYSDDGNVIAEFYSVERKGDKLIIDSRALGVMRMDMTLPREEILRGFRLIFSWAVISYILLLPYFVLKSRLPRGKGSRPGVRSAQ